MAREKRWKKVHFWIEEEEKKDALKDAEKHYGEKGKLSALIRKLLKEHHEKTTSP